jgi:hypothetical protein
MLKCIDIFGYSINLDLDNDAETLKVNMTTSANHKTIEGGIFSILYLIFVIIILTDIK